MCIAITGCTGVLGRIIVKKLRLRSARVSCFQGDIRCEDDVRAWICGTNPQAVIHLAARVPVDVVEKAPLEAFDVNVGGTYNLLKVMTEQRVSAWFFLASSSHVYKSADTPLRENDVLAPQNTYGETKLLAESVVLLERGSVREWSSNILPVIRDYLFDNRSRQNSSK